MMPTFLFSGTLVTWMAYTIMVSGMISIAALFIHQSELRSGRPLRWIWITATVASVLLAIAAPIRTRSLSSGGNSETQAVDQSTIAAPLELTLQQVQELIGHGSSQFNRALILLWIAASATMTVAFVLTYRRVTRQVRRSPSTTIDGRAVQVSERLGPAVVGLTPPQIVIPQWLLTRPPHEQRMAVAHEVEHIGAADPWILALGCAAVSLMPWNPALWYCLSQLRLAVEIDCDRRVILRGIPASTYGTLLIDLSASHASSSLLAPGFPGTASNLKRRLIAMTERPVQTARTRSIASFTIAALVLIAACESRLPTAADVEKMDASSATQYAKSAIANANSPEYVIDEKIADRKTAEALKPEEIATINVLKGSAGSLDQIRIATRKPSTGASTVYMKEAAPTAGFSGLLVIDGEIVSPSMLNSLSPDRIASMEVLKSAAATAQYKDARATYGVIRITTKR